MSSPHNYSRRWILRPHLTKPIDRIPEIAQGFTATKVEGRIRTHSQTPTILPLSCSKMVPFALLPYVSGLDLHGCIWQTSSFALPKGKPWTQCCAQPREDFWSRPILSLVLLSIINTGTKGKGGVLEHEGRVFQCGRKNFLRVRERVPGEERSWAPRAATRLSNKCLADPGELGSWGVWQFTSSGSLPTQVFK